jgi:Fuc2NAc and GlcNAc transferase
MRKYIAISPNVQMLKSEVAIVSMIMVCIILFGLMTFIGVGLYKKIAIRFDIVANPNYRTLHEFPVPRGGGVVFSLFFISFIVILWSIDKLSDQVLFILGVGGFIATLFGFIDDVKNIRAKVKLIIQLLISIWAVYFLYENGVSSLDWSLVFIIPVCLFFMIWMMNAYNFMDGIDGMAASGAIFSSLTIALVLFLTGGPIELMLIFAMIVAAVSGFIVFNWPPASVFMGDAGSVFLGYIFGVLLLFTVFSADLSIWIWLTVFGYFFADTTVTQIMRVVLVKKWYLAHRSHAYQNLARVTSSHLKVVGGVNLYNFIWILPLTIWSSLQPEMEMVAAIFAIIPALIVSYKYGPVFSSS